MYNSDSPGASWCGHTIRRAARAWYAENDRHVSAIQAARFAVSSLGDIRIGWDGVPAVDVITAGFPVTR
ncbi:MAG: hypothetical protein J2P27_00615 [Actinobacteria bacterium]|nr:hypothetical protein [Actinomycetota bacterium]